MCSHNEIEEKNDPNCQDCHGVGTVFVYFADHKHRRVIQEWMYCSVCYPGSDCYQFDHSTRHAEDITSKEAHRLVDEEGYYMHVP